MVSFIHTNQVPAWQFVISFPTKGFQTRTSHSRANTRTHACKTPSLHVSFYSNSRRLIWKSKCSTQPGVFTSAAEGAQTALTLSLSLWLRLSHYIFPLIIAISTILLHSSSLFLEISLHHPLFSPHASLSVRPHLHSSTGPLKKMYCVHYMEMFPVVHYHRSWPCSAESSYYSQFGRRTPQIAW